MKHDMLSKGFYNVHNLVQQNSININIFLRASLFFTTQLHISPQSRIKMAGTSSTQLMAWRLIVLLYYVLTSVVTKYNSDPVFKVLPHNNQAERPLCHSDGKITCSL